MPCPTVFHIRIGKLRGSLSVPTVLTGSACRSDAILCPSASKFGSSGSALRGIGPRLSLYTASDAVLGGRKLWSNSDHTGSLHRESRSSISRETCVYIGNTCIFWNQARKGHRLIIRGATLRFVAVPIVKIPCTKIRITALIDENLMKIPSLVPQLSGLRGPSLQCRPFPLCTRFNLGYSRILNSVVVRISGI
jgi:hypothetical protein